jgi:hypothetical protein
MGSVAGHAQAPVVLGKSLHQLSAWRSYSQLPSVVPVDKYKLFAQMIWERLVADGPAAHCWEICQLESASWNTLAHPHSCPAETTESSKATFFYRISDWSALTLRRS